MSFGKKSFSSEQTCGSASVAAKWAQAICMGCGLDGALAKFQDLVGAETVQVVRLMRNFDRTQMIARQEKSAGKLFARPPRSFSSALLGDLVHQTNLGSVFLLTEMRSRHEVSEALDPFGLREVCVLSLCREQEFSDFLEFQFERSLADHNRQLLEILGSVLSKSWVERAPGVVATLLTGHQFPPANERVASFGNVLGSDNPANLTRSEFRLCTLVRDGSLPEELAGILQVSKSTFRTHLRSIFLKTNVSSHVELVHLLHRSGS